LRLELENFKGVREGSVSLGDFNILMGANNSGKTTVLESLFLAPNPLRFVYGLPLIEVLEDIHSTLESKSTLSILHNYSSETARIVCVLDSRRLEVKFQVTKENDIEVRMFEDGSTYFLGKLVVTMGAIPTDVEFKSKILGETILFHPLLMRRILQYLRCYWRREQFYDIRTKVAKKISECVSEEYEDIIVAPVICERETIYLKGRGDSGVRLGDAGIGVQVLTTLMLLYEFLDLRCC
jgi:hypothetical protein